MSVCVEGLIRNDFYDMDNIEAIELKASEYIRNQKKIGSTEKCVVNEINKKIAKKKSLPLVTPN